MNKDTKIYLGLAIIFGGFAWWMGFGHELITETEGFESFIERYRGYGFLSWQTLVIAVSFLSILFYPPILWGLIWAEIGSAGSIRELLFSKDSWYIWFFPLFFIGLMFMLVALRTIASLAGWALFIGGPIYLFFSAVR